MAKMRATKDFSSTVWGNVATGQVFDVAPGYVEHLVKYDMAEPIDAPPPPVADPTAAAIAALSAAAPKERRGRR